MCSNGSERVGGMVGATDNGQRKQIVDRPDRGNGATGNGPWAIDWGRQWTGRMGL